MKKEQKNPHIGRDVFEFIEEQRAKSPGVAEKMDEHLLRLELARQLKKLREASHLTQEALAEKVGTKQPSIARLERGHSVPKLDLLERIAHALGTRLEVRFVQESV